MIEHDLSFKSSAIEEILTKPTQCKFSTFKKVICETFL